MATASEVDAYVKGNITDVNSIAQESVDSAKEFLDDLAQATTSVPYFVPITDFPNDINDLVVDVDEPDPVDVLRDVDDAVLPTISEVEIPDAPTDTVGPAPIIGDVALPADIPTFNINTFEEEFPDAFPADTLDDIAVTNLVTDFDYNEIQYQSELQDAVKLKLLSDVQDGGTGLDPDVEQAIYDRGEERDLIAMENAIDSVTSEWAKAGWGLPNGVLAANISDLVEKDKLSNLDKSRDIEIKQAELAQTNTHFAIESGIRLEDILLQHANNVANRALEAAKSVVSFGVSLFNVQLDRYRQRMLEFEGKIKAYEANVRGQLADVERYNTEMKGAGLKVDIQSQQVAVHENQIRSVGAIYDLYRTRVDAAGAKTAVEVERLRGFKIKVEAQLEKVRALVATYEADTSRYNANIRLGETQAGVKVKQQELLSRNHEAALRISLENAKANLQSFLAVSEMKIQQSEGGAQIYTNLAGAALNSLNSVISLGSTSAVTKAETTESS